MGIRIQSMIVVKLTWKKNRHKKKMVKKMEKRCTN